MNTSLTKIIEVAGQKDVQNRKYFTIRGIIKDISISETNAGELLCFFTVFDESGEISCIVFPNEYKSFMSLIKDREELQVYGFIFNESLPYNFIVDKVEE